MKTSFLSIIFASLLLLASCAKEEEAIVPREGSSFGTRYEFPQGTASQDIATKDIFDKFGVRLIYKGYDSTHLNRSWLPSSRIYGGKPLTDVQAAYHVQFMKEQIFDQLKPEYAKGIFPPYIYLVNNYYYPSGVNRVYANVSLSGVDYWISSLFTDAQGTPPSTAAKLKENRVKMLANALKIAYDRGKIKDDPAFHALFDYTTEVALYSFNGANFFGYRGFFADLDAAGYAFLANLPIGWSIKTLTPAHNFKSYIFLCMRYTAAELQTLYPIATYPKTHAGRAAMIKYFKDNYQIDLEYIARTT